MNISYFVNQIINGLGIGSIYALIALGYSMVYGIVKLINFAHGDIIMIGGYTMLSLLMRKLPLPLAVLGSILFCMLAGLLIQIIAYRPLLDPKPGNLRPAIISVGVVIAIVAYNMALDSLGLSIALTLIISVGIGAVCSLALFFVSKGQRPTAPRISLLITAIGVSMFLQNLYQLIYGSHERAVPPMITLPVITVGSINIRFVILLNIIVAAVMMTGLTFLVTKTRMGKAMRATSEDAGAAKLMGINTNVTVAYTFVIGSALAAIGAFLYTNSYGTITPTMGGMLGLKAFVAAVLGGIGNIPGAMLGGFLLGLAESMAVGNDISKWSDAIVFGILIIILLFKPTGLLGKNVREKV